MANPKPKNDGHEWIYDDDNLYLCSVNLRRYPQSSEIMDHEWETTRGTDLRNGKIGSQHYQICKRCGLERWNTAGDFGKHWMYFIREDGQFKGLNTPFECSEYLMKKALR